MTNNLSDQTRKDLDRYLRRKCLACGSRMLIRDFKGREVIGSKGYTILRFSFYLPACSQCDNYAITLKWSDKFSSLIEASYDYKESINMTKKEWDELVEECFNVYKKELQLKFRNSYKDTEAWRAWVASWNHAWKRLGEPESENDLNNLWIND